MECFGTTDFDNNSRLITLSAIIISGLHCITIDRNQSQYICESYDWEFQNTLRDLVFSGRCFKCSTFLGYYVVSLGL